MILDYIFTLILLSTQNNNNLTKPFYRHRGYLLLFRPLLLCDLKQRKLHRTPQTTPKNNSSDGFAIVMVMMAYLVKPLP